jgi:hypothetical protein
MFNIVYIPIYYSKNGNITVLWQPFDSLIDNAVYTGVGIWSGFEGSASTPGGSLSFTNELDQQSIIQSSQNYYGDNFSSYSVVSSGLSDHSLSGGNWTMQSSTVSIVSSGFDSFGGYLNGGKFVYPHDSRYGLGDFTVELRVKRQSGSYSDNWGRYVEKGYLNGFALAREAGQDKINCTVVGSALVSNHDLQADTWTHIAFLRSGTSGILYVNGLIDKSVSVTSAVMTNTSDLNLGVSQFGESLRGVWVDDFRLWNVARSSGDIFFYKDKKVSSSEANLINYLTFESSLDSEQIISLYNSSLFSGYNTILSPSTITNSQDFFYSHFDDQETGYYSGVFTSGKSFYIKGYLTTSTGLILIQN